MGVNLLMNRRRMAVLQPNRNLLDDVNKQTGTPSPSTGSNSTSPRVLDINKMYIGLSATNYYYPSYVTVSVENGLITATGQNNAYGASYPIKVSPNTKYTITSKATNPIYGVGYYDDEWNYISEAGALTTETATFTTPANAAYAVIVFRHLWNSTSTYKNVQVYWTH